MFAMRIMKTAFLWKLPWRHALALCTQSSSEPYLYEYDQCCASYRLLDVSMSVPQSQFPKPNLLGEDLHILHVRKPRREFEFRLSGSHVCQDIVHIIRTRIVRCRKEET